MIRRLLNWFDLRLEEGGEATLEPTATRTEGPPPVGAFPRTPSRPARGARSQAAPRRRAWDVVLLYVAVVLGCLARTLVESSMGDSAAVLSMRTFFLAAIIAAVVFRSVYRERLGVFRGSPLLRYFVAFEGGFFWQVVVDTLGKVAAGQ